MLEMESAGHHWFPNIDKRINNKYKRYRDCDKRISITLKRNIKIATKDILTNKEETGLKYKNLDHNCF